MKIILSKNSDDIWVYGDQEQATLAFTVWALTGIELCGFDDWTNTDSVWVTMPDERAELIALREHLLHTFRAYHDDNYRIEMEAKLLFSEATRVATLIEGRKYLSKDKQRKNQSRKASRKERPAAKSTFAEAVRNAMASERAAHTAFKVFIQQWKMDPIDGLRLTELSDEIYEISDENGDLGAIQYKHGTLSKMYSTKTKV